MTTVNHISVMFETYRKIFWCIAILNLSFSFPEHAYAHMIADSEAFLIAGPLIIPFANIIKLIIIALIKPYKEIRPLGRTFLCVVLVEIFLVFFSSSIIIAFIKNGIFYPGSALNSGLTEMQWGFSVIIFYGVLSILPNFSLVKEKNQKLKEIAANPIKISYATILAFITPAIVIFLAAMAK